MKDRIKRIRKDSGLNQLDFANRLGLKQSAISAYEVGSRMPLDIAINNICKEFNVDENWLRTGEGEPYVPQTTNQEIGAFMTKIMGEPEDSTTKAFILAMSKLTDDDWKGVMHFIELLQNK